ncbi:unnamed protein product [Taenia asiatica]|uniref:Arginase n=1 Tax=Taenia asiatica TaxID=60517 RepID=A0A3P6QK94_TAEAS|nr:unnamed protein product [Taenia asiatica]
MGIVAAAVDKGQLKNGVQKGPKETREHGLERLFKKLGAKVNDYGEVTQPKDRQPDVILNCENQRALVKTNIELTECVAKSVSENDMTLMLGGDHSVGFGSIAGHLKIFPTSFVVWVDAHADINTPRSSVSRHTHDVRSIGIEGVMETALKTIMRFSPNCQIHLSFDIDGLDPKYAASTGTPVPGGLSLEEGKYICKTLGQTGENEIILYCSLGLLKSMVVAEVNTLLGSPEDAKTTLNSALEIIKSALLLD